MPTIPDDPAPPRPRPASAPRRPTLRGSWPLLLLTLLLAIGGWRVTHHSGGRVEGQVTSAGIERRAGEAQLEVPRDWVVLDRAPGHVTWGEPDRMHTVTLASTEASTLPLPGVVAATAEQSARELPGAKLVEPPRVLELEGPAPRDDSAMLTRYRVNDGDTRLEIAQVWRRDSRAGLDLVATWTSGDGEWPVSPREVVPHAAASG